MFSKVLVANRGEISVRVIKTLRRLRITSVAVYTDVDRKALHVKLADEAVRLGPPRAYLDVERIVDAAIATGADALHPGYGFLSENPALARACSEAGIVFVGPPASAMEAMGDKINARRTVAASGVPVVPGRDGSGLEDQEVAAAALELGLPVLLKPSAGGGGKGMREVADPAQLLTAVAQARREALSAFGDGTLLVEQLITRPRHIEVQVFGDVHGTVVALGERECSLQRRHQKIMEEAPSPALDDSSRLAMHESAIAAAIACGYTGAGTVEFVVPADDPRQQYFIEMNTRLQVEHPVTEAVLGVDLVELQLRVAAGSPLPWPSQAEVPVPRGHALEARVYAEDPARGFLPASGTVRVLREPRMEGVRVDSALRRGLVVGTEYDPMLSKVVAWGSDRGVALGRLAAALRATAVLGVTTNLGFLASLAAHPAVVAGELDTGLVDRELSLSGYGPVPARVLVAAAQLERLRATRGARRRGPPARGLLATGGGGGPWERGDGWRLTGTAPRTSCWLAAGELTEVALTADSARVGGGDWEPAGAWLSGPDEVVVEHLGSATRYVWASDGDSLWLAAGGRTWELKLVREAVDHAGPAEVGAGPVTSPMPGTVLAVHAAEGEGVAAGQPLISVEAMKMEHVVRSPVDGTVRRIMVSSGDPVALDQPLAVVS